VACVVSPGWALLFFGIFLAAAWFTSSCGRGQAGAPAAAQRRGRTGWTPANGGRSWTARKGSFRACLSGVVVVPGVAGGVVSQTPIRRPAGVRAGAMTMRPGTGLLSHVIERGLAAGSCRWSERARGLATSLVCGCVPGGAGGAGCLRGEQVVGAGQEFAGYRDGGDLLAAPLGDGGVGGGELRGALGGLRCLVHDPPQPGRALLGDVPVPDGQVRAADGGGQPGLAGQFAGAGEPGDVADLGRHHQGGELPGPGQRPEHLDPGSALACWCSSPSIRSVSGARPPVTARQSVTISRELAGRSSSASQPRPGPVQ